MAIPKRNPGRLAFLLVLVTILTACAAPAGRKSAETPSLQTQQDEYRRLLAEARRMSFDLDFSELRWAYLESPEYNPHGGSKLAGLPEAYEALEEAEFNACLHHIDQVLADNYMSLEAHMIGAMCSRLAADYEREDRHRYMAEGIMESIERSGDGKSQSSAYHTISTSELRGFLRFKGLQVLEQSIIYDNEGIYDRMRVRDPESGSEYPLFFNVSQQFVRTLDKHNGKKMKPEAAIVEKQWLQEKLR